MSPKTELELRRKIADLEERIRVLEAGPSQRIEYHYHYAQPYYIPPSPYPLFPLYPVTCGSGVWAPSALTTQDGPHRLNVTGAG